MSVSFLLPDIGEGVAEAQITRWLVSEGDFVDADQPVVEVQTDKVVVELPSPKTGQIVELRWQEGNKVPVGDVLYVLEEKEKGKEKEKATRKRRVLAAPSTRRLAMEQGIDLAEVPGTGPHGRVTDEDVRKQLLQSTRVQSVIETLVAPAAIHVETTAHTETQNREMDTSKGELRPLSPIRRVIAERLSYSVTHKPHAVHFDELNVEGLVAWRKKRTEEGSPPITYTAALCKMIAHTLQSYPLFNAHFDEESQQIHQFPSISLGLATDTPAGLVVPVIHQVETKSMLQLNEEIHQLTEQARISKLSPNQMRGSTFTVSNAGTLGGKWAMPIIQPPEVALLAIHQIERRPVIQGDAFAIGWRMNVSLAFDHRVADGADAIRFTQKLATYTRDPGRLLQELS